MSISTAITSLSEEGPRYRDVAVSDLADEPFERVAELLWTGSLPAGEVRWTAPASDREAMIRAADAGDDPSATMRLIRAATVLHPTDDPLAIARTLLAATPALLGATGRLSARDSFARKLTRVWASKPSHQLERAVNTALVLLADHELATSTLATRVATSVRASAPAALVAGLATVDGDLHGSAACHVHRFLVEAHAASPIDAINDLLAQHRRVPGFGHTIYRNCDPRFAVLLDRVDALPDPDGRCATVHQLIADAGRVLPHPPNIDLALGALSFVAGLDEDIALFAVARIAGWIAHHVEELDERPVRFRGLAH